MFSIHFLILLMTLASHSTAVSNQRSSVTAVNEGLSGNRDILPISPELAWQGSNPNAARKVRNNIKFVRVDRNAAHRTNNIKRGNLVNNFRFDRENLQKFTSTRVPQKVDELKLDQTVAFNSKKILPATVKDLVSDGGSYIVVNHKDGPPTIIPVTNSNSPSYSNNDQSNQDNLQNQNPDGPVVLPAINQQVANSFVTQFNNNQQLSKNPITFIPIRTPKPELNAEERITISPTLAPKSLPIVNNNPINIVSSNRNREQQQVISRTNSRSNIKRNVASTQNQKNFIANIDRENKNGQNKNRLVSNFGTNENIYSDDTKYFDVTDQSNTRDTVPEVKTEKSIASRNENKIEEKKCVAGFTVRKGLTKPNKMSNSLRIYFQEVLTNAGEAWSSGSQEFKAPCKGLYFFTFNAISTKDSDFTIALMKNGEYQVTAYGGQTGYQWGSNSAVLSLNVDDKVYIELQQGDIYEHPFEEAYVTFTGYLINEM